MRSALAAVVLVVAACGSAGAETPPPSSPPGVSAAPATTPVASSQLPVSLTDPKNDLVDADGKKAGRQPLVDIISIGASLDVSDLRLTMTLAGTVPTSYSSNDREVDYLFPVEADGSGNSDYWIGVRNDSKGRWIGDLSDWVINHDFSGDAFPGRIQIADNVVVVSMPLTALGSPSTLRLSGLTQLVEHASGEVIAEDQVPKGDQFEPVESWLTLQVS